MSVKFPKQFLSAGAACSGRFVDGVKSTKVVLNAILFGARFPFPPIPKYSGYPRTVITMSSTISILLIQCRRSQVGPPVIKAVAVFVINCFGRVFARHDLPNKAVCRVLCRAYQYNVIPISMDTSGRFPSTLSVSPRQQSCFRVVGKTLSQKFRRRQRFGLGHLVYSHRQIGQV